MAAYKLDNGYWDVERLRFGSDGDSCTRDDNFYRHGPTHLGPPGHGLALWIYNFLTQAGSRVRKMIDIGMWSACGLEDMVIRVRETTVFQETCHHVYARRLL